MKENDFRIGNYLIDPTGEKYNFDGTCIVTMVSDKRINAKALPELDRSIYKNCGELLKPIPLTIEWLMKFGFCWRQNYDSWVHPKDNKEETTIDLIISKGFYVCDMDHNPEIKYVHQLQNLYFALTGEELLIKSN